jgi:hypothetical protein
MLRCSSPPAATPSLWLRRGRGAINPFNLLCVRKCLRLVSRSAALNHLSACRDEAASSSRRDARGAHTRCRQVLSYRCVGDVPGSAEHSQKALFVMAITPLAAPLSHHLPTRRQPRPADPHCQEATWRTRSTIASSHSSGAVPNRGPDQCEDGVGTRSHKWPWRRARALDGGPSMIMTSIGEVYGVLH